MSDTPSSVLRELAAACPFCYAQREDGRVSPVPPCDWPGHALARKLARVSQETAFEDVVGLIKQTGNIWEQPAAESMRRWLLDHIGAMPILDIAALDVEGGEESDDRQA